MHIWLIKHKSTIFLSDGSYYMGKIMGLQSIKYSSMGPRKVCQLGSFNLDSLLRVFYSFFLKKIYLFGCTGSYLQHVGSSSLTRVRTLAACIGSSES